MHGICNLRREVFQGRCKGAFGDFQSCCNGVAIINSKRDTEAQKTKNPSNVWQFLPNHMARYSRKSAFYKLKMAEREGFEPPVPLPAHLISSQAQSATLSPLLKKLFAHNAPRLGFRQYFFCPPRAFLRRQSYSPSGSTCTLMLPRPSRRLTSRSMRSEISCASTIVSVGFT